MEMNFFGIAFKTNDIVVKNKSILHPPQQR